MDNFSKFLQPGEELKKIIRPQGKNWPAFFTVIFLLFSFFMLFPMWRVGRQGFWLWLILVIFLFGLLISQIINKEALYLLTNRRIIQLKIAAKDRYQPAGSIRLKDIERIKVSSRSLILFAGNRQYRLANLPNSQKIYRLLKELIN